MTNTDRFSAARTLSLTALYISENRRKLLLRTALLVGVMICIAIINIPYSYNWEEWPQREDIKLGDMTALYYFGGLILSCLGSSLMMEDIRSKEGRIRLLMRPTPITETFLSRWLIYVIAFPVIFLLSVALADAIRVGIAAITLPDYYAEFIFRPIFIDNENTRSVLGPPHYIRRILHIHLLLHPVAVCARKHDMDPELVSKNIYCIRGADSHIYDMRHDDRRISHVRKNMARTSMDQGSFQRDHVRDGDSSYPVQLDAGMHQTS